MSLRLRHLRLVAETPQGPYGVDIPLRDGLVVLRADNTSGKSTCVQAIVYALGLEPLLTMRHEVPLPHAMTERLETAAGEVPVIESYVLLEIQNGEGDYLTVQRWAKSESHQINLIRTWEGPALSEPGGGWIERDTYTRRRGSAQRSAGFHNRLERFLGWTLPRFAGTDGGEAQLYLEQLFPLFFVEQKRGWSGIQAQMPPYPGIPDVRSRALEFVLGLEVYERVIRRRSLEEQLRTVAAQWARTVNDFKGRLRETGVVLQGVPDAPEVSWPPEVAPALLVAGDRNWRPLPDVVDELETRLANLDARAVPTAEQAATATEQRLGESERELARVSAAFAQLNQDARNDERQLDTIDRRLEALDEDLRENADARTLVGLGAAAGVPEEDEDCPTCHQRLPATVTPVVPGAQTMTLQENTTFLTEQKQTFQGMRRVLASSFEARLERLSALRQKMSELHAVIRADRQALISPGGNPDLAALQERLLMAQNRDQLTRLSQTLSALVHDLERPATEWAALRAELEGLPAVGLSPDDRRKLDRLQELVVDQLREYGFSSFQSPDEVEISEINYRPAREGYDLGFDLSASDWVRLIWAYLLGLLELARDEGTNHPGLLVLDEPRQQDAAEVSLAALVARAGRASAAGQQVLFATSEQTESLETMLESVSGAQLIRFEGKILQPL